MVADSNEAKVPPIKALIPSLDNIVLFPGASEPIPPNSIPMDAKFAKPHKIYVVITIDFS